MNVGVTGHQYREGVDWRQIAQIMRSELQKIGKIDIAFSSLAIGTDQIFAVAALELSIPVTAVLPFWEYERFFKGDGLVQYQKLIKQCTIVQLNCSENPEQAFLDAGKYIVKNSDVMIAVWDGSPSRGEGGTADVIEYAHQLKRRIRNIDPFNQIVQSI